VLYLVPPPFGMLGDYTTTPPQQRNDRRPRGVGDRRLRTEVDAILSTEIAEQPKVVRHPLQRRRNPIVHHINEVHAFEHQKLNIARFPGNDSQIKENGSWLGGIGGPV
jgi:hypothetical protein